MQLTRPDLYNPTARSEIPLYSVFPFYSFLFPTFPREVMGKSQRVGGAPELGLVLCHDAAGTLMDWDAAALDLAEPLALAVCDVLLVNSWLARFWLRRDSWQDYIWRPLSRSCILILGRQPDSQHQRGHWFC